MRKRKVIYCVMAALIIPTLLVIGCPKPKPAVEEWRIPTIYFLSGPMAGICAPHVWMAEQVVAEMNAAGGIAGKPVVLEFLDSAFDPTKCASCVAQAIDSGALCIHGPLGDAEAKGAMPLAVEAGIFCFSGTCGEFMAQEFNPWTIYSLQSVEEAFQAAMGIWIKHEPDIKSATALEEPIYPQIHLLNEGYLATLEGMGVETFPIIEAPSGMPDYDPIVVKALATGADAFIIGATEEVAAKLVKGLVSGGVDPTNIQIQSGFVGATFLEQAAGYDEGVYCATSPTYAPNPEFARLSNLYKEEHGGQPWTGLTPVTWDMLHMIKAAFENQGITGDPAKLKEERIKIKDYAINQENFEGLDATYDIVDGLAVGYPSRIFQIQNNEAVLVEEFRP